jgi:D-alanyl-D-alanine carboxypeptidase/D-alanyl-D-alanine-endopeptidase (penicillin-binding protein 4)
VLGSVTIVGTVLIGAAWLSVRSVALSVSPVVETDLEIAGDAPIISARRVPLLLSNDVRFDSFTRRLTTLAEKLPASSCLAIDVDGRRIAAKDPTAALLPASNMKILVAAAALETLGPDYGFSTQLFGSVEGNRIIGDLVVVGGGDPGITSADHLATQRFASRHFTPAEEFVTALTDIGIDEITGAVVGVEDRYDLERFAPDLGLGIRGTEVGPLGALMINDGAVSGDPLKPDQPALAAVRQISNMLTSSGITIGGGPRVESLQTEGSPIATIESPPLAEILIDLLSNSDNNTAELLLKEVGLAKKGSGSREAGIEVVRELLQQWGLDTNQLTMKDGAGLDRGNLLSCDLLSAVLVKVGAFGEIGRGLAVAARTGTLVDVFGDTPAAGKLLGKTGTLSGAKALAGFVPYGPTEATSFVIILNGSAVANQSYYRPLWYELGEILTDYTGRPTPLEIAPFFE